VNIQQRMATEFRIMFNQLISLHPTLIGHADRNLCIALIKEEVLELQDAMFTNNLCGIAKELADVLYVVNAAATAYGINMDPVYAEVHRSNMSKVGGHKNADGKWVKPDTYSRADVQPILDVQGQERIDIL
jgi:predicted HAD superfamily Cof-like phosphohydrolase